MSISILDVLKDFDCKKDNWYPYSIETPIGTMFINYRNEMLFTNFIGNEDKAKLALGHWKNNIVAKTENEIRFFIEGLLHSINLYKNKLKNGKFK